MDILQTAGPASNVVPIGAGHSALDNDLPAAARPQERDVTPETFSERGPFYRADHFPLPRRGVPSPRLVALGGPPDLIAGDLPAGQRWLGGCMACYRKTCDERSADWDLRGAAEDVDLLHDIGLRLAHASAWPRRATGSAVAGAKATSDDRRR